MGARKFCGSARLRDRHWPKTTVTRLFLFRGCGIAGFWDRAQTGCADRVSRRWIRLGGAERAPV